MDKHKDRGITHMDKHKNRGITQMTNIDSGITQKDKT